MSDIGLPLVSLCILTYNQERYIREAIEGALSQDYPNLEIIISDDDSTDSTWDVIVECTKKYNGPHMLIVNHNNTNLGIVSHCNKVMYEMIHGDYFILTGGDDVCLPNTVSLAADNITKSNCCAMTFNAYIINGDSQKKGLKFSLNISDNLIFNINDYLSDSYYTTGACRIIKKAVVDTFGPLNSDCQTEDTTNLLRCFLYGNYGYCNIPCLEYRVHDKNISNIHNLMTRFNPQKIASQYKKDLTTALEKGLVSNDIYKRIDNKIDHYTYSSIAKRNIYSQPNKLLRYIQAIFYTLSFKFNMKEIKNLMVSIHNWD